MLNTSTIKYRGDCRNFEFASIIRWQKNCRWLSRNLCILCRQWLRHTSAFSWMLWFGFLINCSTWIILFTCNPLEWWNERQYFCRWSPCFGFFVRSCHSRRTPFNARKTQCSKWQGMMQKTGIQVLKKEFTCYKIRYKSLRKRKLVF